MLNIIKIIVRILISIIYSFWHLLHTLFPRKVSAPLYLTEEEYKWLKK